MKTAMQELISFIETEKTSFEDDYRESVKDNSTEEFLQMSSSAHFMCSMFLSKAKQLLENEREQIEKAHEDGYFDGYNRKYPTHAKHYHETHFNQTFATPPPPSQ